MSERAGHPSLALGNRGWMRSSEVALINETPPGFSSPGAESLCFWWRRGRVELPVQKTP